MSGPGSTHPLSGAGANTQQHQTRPIFVQIQTKKDLAGGFAIRFHSELSQNSRSPTTKAMLVHSWSFRSPLLSPSGRHHHIPVGAVSSNRRISRITGRRRASISYREFRPKSIHVNVSVGIDDLADVVHNRVLIAATLSAAVGQLIKPFASTILYRKNFDLKVALQAGGFPSTHSSTVIATATCLGLERGFADSIFGLAVVYAGLVMYDAQGVRREVGVHARTINMVLLNTQFDSASSRKDPTNVNDTFPVKASTNTNNSDTPIFLEDVDGFQTNKKDSLLLEAKPEPISSDVEGVQKIACSIGPLKESIGHTEFEVIAGALLGFFMGVAVCIIL